jgi:hypothetical protein
MNENSFLIYLRSVNEENVKPHGQVSRDTISRWLNNIMTRGGIDGKKCSSHSVRSAAVSKASAKFVSVDKVLKVAGWSNAKTFCLNNPSKNIVYKGNNKITELRTILQRESPNS